MREMIEHYTGLLKSTIDRIDRNEIMRFIEILEQTRNSGKTIYIMGNGGSGSTATHFCCDFNKGASYGNNIQKRYKCVCLNDNIPTMLAYANDVDYRDVFVEQLKNFLEEGDLVIGISGSGNSANVVRAIEYANAHGAATVGLTGYSGGILREIAKYTVHIPVDNMQIAEDLHLMLFHMTVSILLKQAAVQREAVMV